MDEIVFDRITFLIAASKKRALKLQCVERGVTMTDAMTEAVDRVLGGNDTQAEIDALVTAIKILLSNPSDYSVDATETDRGDFLTPFQIAQRQARAALEPFQEVEAPLTACQHTTHNWDAQPGDLWKCRGCGEIGTRMGLGDVTREGMPY